MIKIVMRIIIYDNKPILNVVEILKLVKFFERNASVAVYKYFNKTKTKN